MPDLGFLGAAALVAAVVAGVVLRLVSGSLVVGDAFVTAACTVTGCSGGWLGFIGWVLALAPVAFAVFFWMFYRGAGRTGRIVWLALASVQIVLVLQFVPDPRARTSGAGAGALAAGMLWGFGTLVTAVVVLLVGLLLTKLFRGSGQWTGIFVMAVFLGGGIGTVVANEDVSGDLLMTTQIFPETAMRVQGDELTRVSATDLEGCAQLYADCSRTAEFEYTTTDSDAVTRLEIVSFPDNDRAWAAWETVRPAEDRTQLRIATVTNEFLLVSTVRHADGRVVQPAEEPWLRWPAAQLEYAFRDAIGYGIAEPPVASETAAPRTP